MRRKKQTCTINITTVSRNYNEHCEETKCNSFHLAPVDSVEMKNIITGLKSDKVEVLGSVRSETLNEIKHEISITLAY